MNVKADRGLKVSDMSSAADSPPGMEDMTENVLSMASLAENPAMMAAAAWGLPEPSGWKRGAACFPSSQSMLSLKSSVIWKLQSKFCRYHVAADARKITVNAFFTNPQVFDAAGRITEYIKERPDMLLRLLYRRLCLRAPGAGHFRQQHSQLHAGEDRCLEWSVM